MTILIALDDGHGMETIGKRTPALPTLGGRQIRENEFNKAVVAIVDKELKRHGFKTILVAPTDADTPLATRVQTANKAKADAYISVHYNAGSGVLNSNQGGIETYFYQGSAQSESLARLIHTEMLKGTTQRNRGLKVGNHLYVVKNTNMPAVLLECGFMDNEREALLMIDPAFQKETADEIVRGICSHFGIKYVPEAPKSAPAPTPAPQPAPIAPKYDPKDPLLSRVTRDFIAGQVANHGVAQYYLDIFDNGTITTEQILGLFMLSVTRK